MIDWWWHHPLLLSSSQVPSVSLRDDLSRDFCECLIFLFFLFFCCWNPIIKIHKIDKKPDYGGRTLNVLSVGPSVVQSVLPFPQRIVRNPYNFGVYGPKIYTRKTSFWWKFVRKFCKNSILVKIWRKLFKLKPLTIQTRKIIGLFNTIEFLLLFFSTVFWLGNG